MRWDIKVANYYYFAAALVAVCVMAAPSQFHLEGAIGAIIFWANLGGAICVTIAGFHASLKGERFAPATGHKRRMVGLYGMVLCATGFIGFAAAYLWPSASGPQTGNASAHVPDPAPAISLSRPLSYDGFTPTLETLDGQSYLKGWSGTVTNRGSFSLKLTVAEYHFNMNGSALVHQAPQSPKYIGIGHQFAAYVNLDNKVLLKEGKASLMLDLLCDYDTVPETGNRRSYISFHFEVTTTSAGSSVTLQEVTAQKED